MAIDMSQFYQVFFEETAEHLDTMERLLLAIDIQSPDPDDLNAIFRAAHSIKGGSGTFGFTDMTEVTHVLETLLDKVRKEVMALRSDMIDVFLEAGDVLREKLEAHQAGTDSDPGHARAVIEKLDALANGTDQPLDTTSKSPSIPDESSPTPEKNLLIRFPLADTGNGSDIIDNLTLSLEEIGKLALLESPTQGNQGISNWAFSLKTFASTDSILELLSFVTDPDQVSIEISENDSSESCDSDDSFGFFEDVKSDPEDEGYGFFTEETSTPSEAESEAGYGFFTDPTPAPVAEPPVQAPPVDERNHGRRESDNPSVTVAKSGRRDTDKVAVSSQQDSSIRVSVDKVDQLINLVGELVITQAMLAQTASEVDQVAYEKLLNGMAQLERNTRDLQESVMSIRMMPISFVFSRFPRVVRDLAGKLNKQVELKTTGEGTELDKGLIEKLTDPLTHLIRNSLDHGIETPEVRIAAGKDAKGTIHLAASHQGGNIVIEVADDGAGLNRDRILAKARERNIPVNDNITDQEVWQLIFAPGFSTAEAVTDVSGRGVGMDVVKRNIESLGGRVEIESSQGQCTKITVRLPLTLAILDGMSISVGNEIFIMPLTYVVESLQPSPGDLKTVNGNGRVVQVRGDYLPLTTLHRIFGIKPRVTDPSQGIIVIIEAEGQKYALFVDELVGQHQVVIKSLESNYRKVPGISGATIMGDGRVALILDIAALVRLSQA